jgi:NTE family protein
MESYSDILKSKSIGLALSGGGNKRFSSGVLQFLAEINIRPQAISGTSAGGVVGALYAWGKHPKKF